MGYSHRMISWEKWLHCLFPFLFLSLFSSSFGIKLAVMESDPNLFNFCQQGIQFAAQAGACKSDIQVIQKNSCISTMQAVGTVNAAEAFFKEQVNGFIAPTCMDEMAEITRLSYFWGVPVITRNLVDIIQLDRSIFPTMASTSLTTITAFAAAIQIFANYINQTTLTVVGSMTSDGENYPIAQGLSDYYQFDTSLTINQLVMIDENIGVTAANSLQMKLGSRLIVIAMDFGDAYSALNSIGLANLNSLGFAVLLLCPTSIDNCLPTTTMKSLLQNQVAVVLAPNPLLQTATQVNQSASFYSSIPQASLANMLSMTIACATFCAATSNGGTVATFNPIIGTLQYDSVGTLLLGYSFQTASSSGTFSPLLILSSVPSDCTMRRCFQLTIDKTANAGLPDPSSFFKSLATRQISNCIAPGSCTSILGYGLGGGVLGILIIVAATFYLIRRKSRMNVFRMHWKVPKADLKVIENKQGAVKNSSRAVMETLVNKRRAISSYALMGTNKAEFIVMKHESKIRWTPKDLKFLFELKQITQDNLAKFMGICCNEGDKFYLLTALIERASLEDFIMDPDFNMDTTFKSAFIRDILKGLQYLHKSPVGFHGLLTVQNCLIDHNWVLKLSNFGVSTMLNELVHQDTLRCLEPIPLNVYPMFAPENLEEVEIGKNYPLGTKAGDVYSMGMILFYLVNRQYPFDKHNMPIRDLISAIKKQKLRPDVSGGDQEQLGSMMEQCWHHDETQRPSIKHISNTVNNIFAATKGNLVDQMIKMNEKFAQNLEKIVAERSALLQEAQEQTDRLLNEMLPISIALTLKAGGTITPRSYDSATVLFVQMCDFAILVGRSGPEEVIQFLNDIYEKFDLIIKKHDAYKVETTGETYMVASGVPNENDGRHVFEIAEICLEIREESYVYKVAHCIDFQVRVRIGFHCGPIAAGVIGLRSPRYCLFGDTVNFASRMQSNCPPNQIQTSEITAKLLMESSEYELVKRGIVHVKGKGEVNCYWLNEHIHDNLPQNQPLPPKLPS